MKEININTQKEFDKLTEVKSDENVIIELNEITLKCNIHVYGKININALIKCGAYYIYGWENSTLNIDGRENSTLNIYGWGNSTLNICGRGNSAIRLIRILCKIKIQLFNFSVIWIPINLKIKIAKKSTTCHIIKYEKQKYLDRECIKIIKSNVILFKKVSKDFKTQENTKNETLWKIGSIITHPNWYPKQSECGEGKFHACSTPYFCDEFRNEIGDKYIAVKIHVNDLYEWENGSFPHKIAFRKGKVLYECDKKGNKI